MTLSPLANVVKFSPKPMQIAEEIKDHRGGEIGSRLLSLLQIVTSLLAMPILLLVGVLEAAFLAITCRGKKALEALQTTGENITLHLLGAIPYSIFEAILPTKWANITNVFVMHGAGKAANLWKCSC